MNLMVLAARGERHPLRSFWRNLSDAGLLAFGVS